MPDGVAARARTMHAPRTTPGWIALGIAAAGLLVTSGPAVAQICGDADKDGRVTDSDAVLAFRRAANLPSPCKLLTCDTNGDGSITEGDALGVLRKAAGLTIVERCGRGEVTGRVLIGETNAIDAREREPNDVASVANLVGRLRPGTTKTLAGRIDPSTDPFDGYVVLIDTPVTLDLRLRFRRGADADLLVTDPATALAVTCEGTASGREDCRIDVDPDGDTRAVHVVVAPSADSLPTEYELTIHTASARRRAVRLAPRSGAAPPAAIAAAVYLGREADFVPGEVIVQPAGAGRSAAPVAGTPSSGTRRALAAVGIADTWQPTLVAPSGAELCVHVDAARDRPADAKQAYGALRRQTRDAVALLNREPRVAWAQPNYVARVARMPNDPLLPQQWHYRTIGLDDAWDLTIGDDSVIVAVIDTGIRSDHPDIAARLVPGYDFITDRRRANDGDGPDPDPFDPGDMPGSSLEGSFHGTHVTGTIAAATDNASGVAGVTWRTRAMPLRALGVGGGSTFDIAQAIRFAAGLENASGRLPNAAAAVINLSLVAFGDDPFMRAAVDAATEAGVLVIAAAGNTASDVTVSPAVYENTLTVTASDALGAPARYAAFGAAVDLIAPGGDTAVDLNADDETDGILSTVLPGSRDFRRFQGTSMAAAHVSGVAALVLARAGPLGPGELRAALLATAADRGSPGRDDRYGFGLVDPAAAIRFAADLVPPTTPALALDSDALSFGSTRATLGLHARNTGGGVLTLATPSVHTDGGLDWLGARLDQDPTLVSISTDRRQLVPGTYAGQVVIPSNGGTHTLPITMQVDPRPEVDVGPVTVALLASDDGTTVAEVVTTFADGYAYRFEDVPGGPYDLRAGTDRDHDHDGCDIGELCGAFPTADTPRPITVIGGATLQGLDFVVGTVSVTP